MCFFMPPVVETLLLWKLMLSNVFINDDISYNEVEKAVKSLKVNKAVGFDGIPNEVLKQGSIICILH